METVAENITLRLLFDGQVETVNISLLGHFPKTIYIINKIVKKILILGKFVYILFAH